MFERSRRSSPELPALSNERKRWVLRYLTDTLDEEVEDVPAPSQAEHPALGARTSESLSDERKQLVFRYMADPLEQDVEDMPTVEAGIAEPAEAPEVSGHVSDNETVQQLLPVVPAAGTRPARRGRPPGRKVRRQVHFHVDPDEDRLLLAAAGRFGSQQKGLIAALKALDELEELRERLRLLEAERQSPEA